MLAKLSVDSFVEEPLLGIRREDGADEDVHGGAGLGLLEEGSNLSCVYSICSICLGVGAFVLPGVFRSLGYIMGSFMFSLFALVSYSANMALVRCAGLYYDEKNPDSASFQSLAGEAKRETGICCAGDAVGGVCVFVGDSAAYIGYCNDRALTVEVDPAFGAVRRTRRTAAVEIADGVIDHQVRLDRLRSKRS